jgi:hypothetical protein
LILQQSAVGLIIQSIAVAFQHCIATFNFSLFLSNAKSVMTHCICSIEQSPVPLPPNRKKHRC